MSVDQLLKRVMAQNDLIIRQNERLLRMLLNRNTQTFDEVTEDVAAELKRRLALSGG